jgi:hypothetical protein
MCDFMLVVDHVTAGTLGRPARQKKDNRNNNNNNNREKWAVLDDSHGGRSLLWLPRAAWVKGELTGNRGNTPLRVNSTQHAKLLYIASRLPDSHLTMTS